MLRLVTPTEWQRREDLVAFGHNEADALRELHLVARAYADEVMTELYGQWLAHAELASFFTSPAELARVKRLQREYFISLTAEPAKPTLGRFAITILRAITFFVPS